ncbi:acyl-CoA thioesterase [Janibacter terrae]|uniref:acyl-CoA thioesterase n=1 Tax=Janibacter terrae TaxID=103817 RepID=UPI00082C9D12|nr:acyl-CoA thioesterase domain-containing protein [Janibacter terrae]
MVDDITLRRLWEMLTLTAEQDEDGGEVWSAPDQPVPDDRVFGGLLLAQAVVVAGQGMAKGVAPLSLQADFLAGVPVTGRNRWRATTLGEAPSMVSRRVALVADDGAELFTATVRLGRVREDLPSYADLAPRRVAGPDGLVDLATRYGGDERIPVWWRIPRPVDLRHVEEPTFLEPSPERSSEQSLWWRLRGELADDPLRIAAVIAYVSDMSLVEPAFRSTGTSRHVAGSRILSLTHTMTFHDLPDLVDWVQMDVAVRRVAHGRALGAGEVFTGGRHVASLGQLALVKLA